MSLHHAFEAIVAVTALSLLSTPAVAADAPQPSATAEEAFSQIAGCVSTSEQTNVLFVIDESLSLRDSDPDNQRSQALKIAIGGLADLQRSAPDKKIMVAQYMVGQSANFGTSDPAMLLTVPTEQYRTDYLFYAATSWQANFVDIIAPKGASVKVDGVNVANWKGIGNSGFDIAHVQLANNGNGTHTVSGDQKVGISVYGLQSYGSYWYPGGLDLDLIPQ